MTFRHEALLYAGEDELLARLYPFVREGLAAGDAVMVAVSDRKIRRLRDALGPAAEDATFADMDEIGGNPGRIIHAWHEFAEPHLAADRPVRGVGEPISAGRSRLTAHLTASAIRRATNCWYSSSGRSCLKRSCPRALVAE